MKSDIKYIELATGGYNGPAWIGLVFFSKSGKSLYFNGKAFQKIGRYGLSGNYYDVESGEEYWISGVKKDMTDRHRFGSGKIHVEERILEEYLTITKQSNLDNTKFILCNVDEEIPVERIHQINNQKDEDTFDIDENKRFLKPSEFTAIELDYFIEYYREDATEGKYLKGRKHSRIKMNELIIEKEKRNISEVNL